MLLISRECTEAISLDTSCELSIGKKYGEEDEKAYQIIAEYAGGIVELRTSITAKHLNTLTAIRNPR